MTPQENTTRTPLIWLALFGTFFVALFILIWALGDLRQNILAFELLFAALFLCYLAAVFFIWRRNLPQKQALMIIIIAAILARLVMSFSAPTLSSDIIRYAWDGKIQNSGYDPYAYAPNDPQLSALQDKKLYGQLSPIFIDKPGVYPPGAELFFRVGALSKSNTVLVLKLLLALIDIGSIWLLVLILRRLRIDPNRAVIFAWSPLVVIEVCQSGHIDGLMTFFVLAAILAALKGKDFAAGVWTALGVAVKLFPAALLPALYRKRDWKLPLGFGVGLVLVFLPYWRAAPALFGLTTQMKYQPRFNSSLLLVFQSIFGDTPTVHTVYVLGAVFILAITGIIVWLRQDGSDERMMQGLFTMAAFLLVLLPFLQPWYLVLIIPLLAWRLSPAFLYISGAAMLSYLVNAPQPWISAAASCFEFIPFFILLAGEVVISLRRSRQPLLSKEP